MGRYFWTRPTEHLRGQVFFQNASNQVHLFSGLTTAVLKSLNLIVQEKHIYFDNQKCLTVRFYDCLMGREESIVQSSQRVFEQSKNLFDTRYERRSLKLKTLLIEAASRQLPWQRLFKTPCISSSLMEYVCFSLQSQRVHTTAFSSF